MKSRTRALLCIIIWHPFLCSKMLLSILSTAAWTAAAARSPWWPPTVPWTGTAALSGTVPASSASFQDRPSTIMNTGTCPRKASVTSSHRLKLRAWRPPMCELEDAAKEKRACGNTDSTAVDGACSGFRSVGRQISNHQSESDYRLLWPELASSQKF